MNLYQRPKKPCSHCGRVLQADRLAWHNRFCPYDPQRFWSRVDRKGPQECWHWQGCVYNRYGAVNFRQRFQGAHRVAWILTNGEIPAGQLVQHDCDQPLCCNPAHLRLGTDATNHADMVRKDRHAKGERIRKNKLTEKQVRAIRSSYRKQGAHRGAPSNARTLAAKYGVGVGTIQTIVARRTWRHVE